MCNKRSSVKTNVCLDGKFKRIRVDPCIRHLPFILSMNGFYVVACCCGHGKYPMSVVVKFKLKSDLLRPFEIFSGKVIPRKIKFYKRDKQGYYYIPEVIENEKEE